MLHMDQVYNLSRLMLFKSSTDNVASFCLSSFCQERD